MTKKWDSDLFSGELLGGFNRQKEIRDNIEYASKRNITILPKIEMPRHASATIADLSCFGTKGELPQAPIKFGKLSNSHHVSYNRVYNFIHDELVEVMESSPHLHKGWISW